MLCCAVLCILTGQIHHRIESTLKIRAAGHKFKHVKDVPEELAVQTGANFLSEAFVFSVAAGLLIFEVQRKNKQDEAAKVVKQEKEAAQHAEYMRRFEVIELSLQRLQQQLYNDTNNMKIKAIDEDTKYKGWFNMSWIDDTIHTNKYTNTNVQQTSKHKTE